MFEDRFKEPVNVLIPSGTFSDGKADHTEHQGYALITDLTQMDIKKYGIVKNAKIFLLRCETQPVPGSKIIHLGKNYDLEEIRICQDLDGNIECYRCVVV